MPRFAETKSFDDRRKTSQSIVEKYPNMVPVICEPGQSSLLDLSTYSSVKYIVHRENTLGKFLMRIRANLNLAPEVAMFIFVNNILPPVAATMGELYEKHKSKDGFLYLEFSGENVFG